MNPQHVATEEEPRLKLDEGALIGLVLHQVQVVLVLVARQAMYCPGYGIEGSRKKIAEKYYSANNEKCQRCQMARTCRLVVT